MAASLSRPDPSSPASVAEAGFTTSRRGFSQDEVRAFLTSVAAELGRLQERERQLEAELSASKVDVPMAPELDDETVAAMLGEETLRVLQTARESANQIKIRAEEAAAKTLNDANDEANRHRQDAEVEAARKRHDAASDAEAEVALAKQQGREMVNEARAYRERVLADLERRTKLARQQIEDLVHGRDRLLQVFERARLVAVDVTSELQSIDGPDEFVNFSPTTGPLPLMVPASELDRSDVIEDDVAGYESTSVESETSDPVTDDDESDATSEASTAQSQEAEIDEVAEVDDAAQIDDTAETDDAADTDDEADTDDTAESDDRPDRPSRDANVVSLFRDRGSEPSDGDVAGDGSTESADPDETESTSDRPDVDGIFERLRSESPGDQATADTDVDAGADDAGEAEPDRDTGAADAEPTPFSRRDEALVPLVVAGARKLKRVLADEQNGALDLLRQKQPVTQLDDLIAEVDEHSQSYIDALSDELLEAAVAGAREVGKRDTKTLRTTLTKGGALERSAAVVRDDIVVALRDRLERAVADGGGDNDDITKRVRAVYREWKTQHIDDQLDDAFRFAYGGGTAAGVKPGTSLVWMIDPAEPTCADCEDNSLAAAVTAGEEFPTGHVAAPAHPGCRCLTLPNGQ